MSAKPETGSASCCGEPDRGEATLITDRGKPVATLEPWRSDAAADGAAMLLVQRGIAAPRARLDLEAFLAAPRPRLRAGVRASDAVTRERDESR